MRRAGLCRHWGWPRLNDRHGHGFGGGSDLAKVFQDDLGFAPEVGHPPGNKDGLIQEAVEIEPAESFATVSMEEHIELGITLKEKALIILREGGHSFDRAGDDDFLAETGFEVGFGGDVEHGNLAKRLGEEKSEGSS